VQSEAAVTALSALANEHRLALFRLLVQTGQEGLAAGALAKALDVPGSSLSFHLAQLTQTGLVAQERRGRSLIYSANYRAMDDLVGYLMANCCARSTSCGPDADRSSRTESKSKRASVKSRSTCTAN
jgi:ArsR family transcriptional regulator